jgi:hypothetical protein
MSCRNPNTEISAEISETLETLGSKIENAQNFILRVSGGALEEAVLSYAKNSPNVQVLRAETEKEGGSYEISGNPRRVVRFCKKRTVCLEVLCNGFFKTYALIPC